MQKGSEVASDGQLAFAVPFSWEEKPGVAKEKHFESSSHEINITIPPHEATPLQKPPCLQDLPCRQHSLSSTAQAGGRLGSHHGSSSAPTQLLVRKPSLNHILPLSARTPLARKYSLGNLQPHHHSTAARRPLIRLQDDPFFMALQTCRKEPIRVYFRDATAKYNCASTAPAPAPTSQHQRSVHNVPTKPLTIRQLCTLQGQEEQQQLKRAQPLLVSHTFQKEHKKAPFSVLSRCLGC